MSRWKASGIHLLLSVAIVGAVLLCMLGVWYPRPLFEAAGGNHLIFILASVDVTIGPLLTAIVWDNDPRALVRWKEREWTIRDGGLFDEFEVRGITRDQVTLVRGDETLVLKRHNPGE